MGDPLATYLHDHLGGAQAALDLLKAMQQHRAGQPWGLMAATLYPEVKQDFETLLALAKQSGSEVSAIKQVAGWVAEKLTRWKLGQTSDDPLETFEALEFLVLGILGKAAMWRALGTASVRDPRLRGFDYQELAARAESQYRIVEEHRISLAAVVFRG